MKKLKFNAQLTNKLKVFGLAFFTISITSCGSASTNPNQPKTELNKISEVPINKSIPSKDPAGDIEKAKKDGNAVFIVITGKNAVNVDKAVATANSAKSKISKSTVVEMNRDDIANNTLVVKYGVTLVPVPFFLVISPKGLPVAGYTIEQATAELLINAVPSPKEDEVLFALSEKKPVFIVVSKKGLTDKATTLANCKSASNKIASKPAIIEFDINDAKEKDFLKQIGITSIEEKTITVVANVSGQITDKYEGVALESALISSANKVIKSGGCCPSGSTSGCGPKK